MKKYEVEYQGGESRWNPGEGIDYMMVTVPVEDEEGYMEDVELYAEATSDPEDENASYDDLKEQIIEQAQERGIDPETLKFWYD